MTEIQIIYTGPIVKRADAKSAGLTKYFTGIECINNHIDERWTCSSRCKTCQSKSSKKYQDENKDDIKVKSSISSKKNWKNNKEKLSERHRIWRLNNKESRRISQKKFREKDISSYNEKMRLYRSENKDAFSEYNKRNRDRHRNLHKDLARKYRARKYLAEGCHDHNDIAAILDEQNYKCANNLCEVSLSDIYHIDHIIPLALGGSNWPNNLQCLCIMCNTRKGKMHPDKWDIRRYEYVKDTNKCLNPDS